jgi:pimeloyl-ACP methyl ester carboxylesterase
VLIHGLATTRVIWRHAVPLLSAGRRVITLDVPGFGESPPAGEGFDLAEVAKRIGATLRRAGVAEPFDLVGHSMGGAVALVLAALDPDAIARLVLVAPAGLRPMPAPAARAFGTFAKHAIPLRRRGAPLADFAWGRRLLMTPGTADPASIPPADVRAMLAASRGATRIGEALATVASADVRPLLAKLPVHVGAVWGARDRIVPPGGIHTLEQLRPEAPTATVPNAGHILMVERPDEFAEALEDVLERLSPNGNMSRAFSA